MLSYNLQRNMYCFWLSRLGLPVVFQSGENSLELTPPLQHPGRNSNYIVVGRNVPQWRASIDYFDATDEIVDQPALTNPKSRLSGYDSHNSLD